MGDHLGIFHAGLRARPGILPRRVFWQTGSLIFRCTKPIRLISPGIAQISELQGLEIRIVSALTATQRLVIFAQIYFTVLFSPCRTDATAINKKIGVTFHMHDFSKVFSNCTGENAHLLT